MHTLGQLSKASEKSSHPLWCASTWPTFRTRSGSSSRVYVTREPPRPKTWSLRTLPFTSYSASLGSWATRLFPLAFFAPRRMALGGTPPISCSGMACTMEAVEATPPAPDGASLSPEDSPAVGSSGCSSSGFCSTTSHYITLHYSTLQYITLQYSTVQYSTVHYITLHHTTVHYTALFYIALHCIALHCITVQYNTLQYNTIQYNTIQYNTIQYNTVQYSTIQYNTIQYNTDRHVHTYIYIICIYRYMYTHIRTACILRPEDSHYASAMCRLFSFRNCRTDFGKVLLQD